MNEFLTFSKRVIVAIFVLVVVGWTYDRVMNRVALNKQYIPLAQAQQALNTQAQQYEVRIKELQGGKK